MSALVRPRARDAILEAAAHVASQDGALAVTVDRVVERAGVSKGAFFYHFATKEAMMAALLERMADGFDDKLRAWTEEGTPFSRALIAATFDEVALRGPILCALIAAIAVDRSLASIVIGRTAAWNAKLAEEGFSPDQILVLRLTLDGLLLSATIRSEPATADELTALGAALARVLGTGSSPARP